MFQQITFEQLEKSTIANSTPSTLDSLVCYNETHNYTQVYSATKRMLSNWDGKQAAIELAAELGVDFFCDNECRSEVVSARIKYCLKASEMSENRLKLIEDTYICPQGAVKWKSSHNCVPSSFFRDCMVDAPASQKRIDEEDTKVALEQYIKGQRLRTPEQKEEQKSSMRAAFGSGQTLVDAITGEKIRT